MSWSLPPQKNSAEVAVPGKPAASSSDRFDPRSRPGRLRRSGHLHLLDLLRGRAEGAPAASQYLSKRTTGGWATENISPFGFICNPALPPYAASAPTSLRRLQKSPNRPDPRLPQKASKASTCAITIRASCTASPPNTPGAPEVRPCLRLHRRQRRRNPRLPRRPRPKAGEVFTYSLYEWLRRKRRAAGQRAARTGNRRRRTAGHRLRAGWRSVSAAASKAARSPAPSCATRSPPTARGPSGPSCPK